MNSHHRMQWILLAALMIDGSAAQSQTIDPAKAIVDANGAMVWYDLKLVGLEGQAFADVKAPFDRLPAQAEGVVRADVWNLSRQSAGLCARFVTDAPEIHAKWTLTSANLAMPHMPATGVSGLDLYMRSPKDGTWRWLGAGRPSGKENTASIGSGYAAGKHEFMVYLPLYNGVSAVSIGIGKGKSLEKAPAYPAGQEKPVVFYGTSITQGGCASRPGMVHTAILGRRLGVPVVNLGFSGNGRMETEVGRFMAQIDASVYVIDCLPNMDAAQVASRTEPLVKQLRAAHPHTPIVLVEDRSYSNAALVESNRQRNESSRAALWSAYRKLVDTGASGLHYLPGDRLLAADGDGTVDNSHPTDLGFSQHADAFEAVLRPLLPKAMAAKDRKPVEAYTNSLSYKPGDTIQFHIASQGPKAQMEVFRVAGTRESVWKGEPFAAPFPAVPAIASSHGCDWPVATTVKVPNTWKSGYYIAKIDTTLADGKPASGEAWFVVRSARPGSGNRILLQLSTNTYNAYTNWGGYSLYAYNGRDKVQGQRVSFNRPITSQFMQWEQPFVAWAEKSGYSIDYAVNSDLEQIPDLLKGYKLVLSVGHDEYWSAGMRNAIEQYTANGGNVAFLSGNTCCWQVRPEENGRALVCFKQAHTLDPFFDKGEHRLLSSLWSHHLAARPENTMTGVGFLWGGYRKSHGQFMTEPAEFTVHRPEHWLFEGTDLKRGGTFGAKDTVVGYECDGCELTWKDGVPTPSFKDGTPTTMQVLATCPARWHPNDCEFYDRWEKGRTGNAVFGIHQRGGTVVTTGTTDWAHGLRGNDPAVTRITRNLLDKLSR